MPPLLANDTLSGGMPKPLVKPFAGTVIVEALSVATTPAGTPVTATSKARGTAVSLKM